MASVPRKLPRVTAADVKAALTRYYAPPSHRVFFEVSNDTGAKSRRWIDALALGIWPSTGYEIVGIEIKVSRSDFLSEMRKPAKAQELMRFCDRWYLAAPLGVVRAGELPKTWGLLEYADGAVRQRTLAPPLEPEPLTPGFVMAVLRQANSVDPTLVKRLVDEQVAKMRERIDEEVRRGIEARTTDVTHRNKRAEEVAAELEAVTGVAPHDWEFDRATLAAAYLLLKETGLHRSQAWGFSELSGAAKNLRDVAATIQAVCEDERFAAIRNALEVHRGAKRRK